MCVCARGVIKKGRQDDKEVRIVFGEVVSDGSEGVREEVLGRCRNEYDKAFGAGSG